MLSLLSLASAVTRWQQKVVMGVEALSLGVCLLVACFNQNLKSGKFSRWKDELFYIAVIVSRAFAGII